MFYFVQEALQARLQLLYWPSCSWLKKTSGDRLVYLGACQLYLRLTAVLLDGPFQQEHLAFPRRKPFQARRIELARHYFVSPLVTQFQVEVRHPGDCQACLQTCDKQPAAYGAACLHLADSEWSWNNRLISLKWLSEHSFESPYDSVIFYCMNTCLGEKSGNNLVVSALLRISRRY